MKLDDIRSNQLKRCADCGIPITPANDSGWEVFAGDGKKTQPVCAWCDATRQLAASKAKAVERIWKRWYARP